MDIRKAWTLEKHVHTVKNSRENREATPRPSIFPRNIGKIPGVGVASLFSLELFTVCTRERPAVKLC
jgi:hypothetical protein